MRRFGSGGAPAPCSSIGVAFALGALLASVTASAEENPESGGGAQTLLEWDAPEGCPSADAVYQSLSDARGEAGLRALSHVRGSIRERGAQWVLALEIEDDGRRRTRWIEAHDCADLADAAALAIHLAASGVDAAQASAPAAAPELPNVPAPAAREQSALDAIEVADEPLPLSPRWSAVIDASAVMDLNALSLFAWGPRVGARARYGRLAAGLALLWLPPVAVGVRPGQSVAFTLATVEASGCYRVLEARVSGDVCAGVEVGRFGANGDGLSRDERDFAALWLAPQLGLELSAGLGEEFALVVRGQVLAPLLSETYAVNGGELVYEAAPFVGRFSVGLSFAPVGN